MALYHSETRHQMINNIIGHDVDIRFGLLANVFRSYFVMQFECHVIVFQSSYWGSER